MMQAYVPSAWRIQISTSSSGLSVVAGTGAKHAVYSINSSGAPTDKIGGAVAKRAARRHEDEGAVGPHFPREIVRRLEQVLVVLARFDERVPHVVAERQVTGKDEQAVSRKDRHHGDP